LAGRDLGAQRNHNAVDAANEGIVAEGLYEVKKCFRNIADCRFLIADWIFAILQSAIGNRQSAMVLAPAPRLKSGFSISGTLNDEDRESRKKEYVNPTSPVQHDQQDEPHRYQT
jgi:hypothetical protein